MKISFQRLTSTGYYNPAVDGLRFVAITSVVFYHLMVFFRGKSLAFSSEQFNNTLLMQLFERGYVGVPLFFVISGFILGLPFAKHYLLNDKPISLRSYFIRRITRLEVPYLIALTLLLVGAVYFAKVMTLQDGIKSYIASVFYVHNIVFQNFPPKISAVTWSLEVEVQFYILAPLLARIFIIHGQILRRLTFVILAALSIMINAFQLSPFSFNTLIDYFHYFIIG